MRELEPWAQRSNGREAHRAFYAAYIHSSAWFQRRTRWVEDERELLLEGQQIACVGCSKEWALKRDDLHHVSYERLGNEAHEDLWPMCRSCHSWIHELLRSSRSWRRLALSHGSVLALQQLHLALDTANVVKSGVHSLRTFL